jgi:hypothetical protein
LSIAIGSKVSKVNQAHFTPLRNWTPAYGPVAGDIGVVKSFIPVKSGPEEGQTYAEVEYVFHHKGGFQKSVFTVGINTSNLVKVEL